MANIANNSYMFYGDKTELTKCHEELSKLYEKDNGKFSCVHETENVVVSVCILLVNGTVTQYTGITG